MAARGRTPGALAAPASKNGWLAAAAPVVRATWLPFNDYLTACTSINNPEDAQALCGKARLGIQPQPGGCPGWLGAGSWRLGSGSWSLKACLLAHSQCHPTSTSSPDGTNSTLACLPPDNRAQTSKACTLDGGTLGPSLCAQTCRPRRVCCRAA